LNRIDSPYPELVEMRDQILKIDLKRAEQMFYQQLIDNRLKYWPQVCSELDGLYFEIMDFYHSVVMADVYGIICKTLKMQPECYMLGYEIKFGEHFDRLYGVEHDESPISLLYEENDEEEDKQYYHDSAYKDLEAGYCLSFYLALHNAMRDFTKTEAFLSLPRKKPFHVLIAIHDDGPAYPVWIEE
jgi:hypothetical protein